MKTLVAAFAMVVLVGLVAVGPSAAFGQGYYAPTVVEAYYPGTPVYSYSAPAPYAYAAPVMVPGRRIVYSPVVTAPVVVSRPIVMTRPVVVASPMMVPAPVVVARPVVIGVTGKIYIPGRPIRNAVVAVAP